MLMTSHRTTIRIASTITTIRRPLFRGTSPFRETAFALRKLNLQYLQVSACCGQMPPQFGQVCANILSDIFREIACCGREFRRYLGT
jgi:hypothetical protein